VRKSDYYLAAHQKHLRSLAEILQKIRQGIFMIRSLEFVKESVGSGYRLTIYLREKE
jgi:hypothetical protein